MTTFIDTNALIYVLDDKSPFHKWATSELEKCRAQGPALIADLVYCEFSIAMPSRQATDEAIEKLALERVRGTRDALFKAGQAFLTYRKAQGKRERVLPDFIIGAIAADAGASLITANKNDFATYFPQVNYITP